MTLSRTVNDALECLSSLPILMQESFWWCHNIAPLPIPPTVSPSLISLRLFLWTLSTMFPYLPIPQVPLHPSLTFPLSFSPLSVSFYLLPLSFPLCLLPSLFPTYVPSLFLPPPSLLPLFPLPLLSLSPLSLSFRFSFFATFFAPPPLLLPSSLSVLCVCVCLCLLFEFCIYSTIHSSVHN